MNILKNILSRQKGNKDYAAREKQVMISLMNEYSLFGATDDEMIQMLSIKISKENNLKFQTFFLLVKERSKQKEQNQTIV